MSELTRQGQVREVSGIAERMGVVQKKEYIPGLNAIAYRQPPKTPADE